MARELEFRDQLLSTLRAYFPDTEFVVEIVRSPQTFALIARVRHRMSRHFIDRALDDSVEQTYAGNIIRSFVEMLAADFHLDLVKHGFSNRVQIWTMDPWIVGPAEIEEIKATIAITGYELRYRERQGLGAGYYLFKTGEAIEVPPSMLTAPIQTWKIYLGQLLDRSLKS